MIVKNSALQHFEWRPTACVGGACIASVFCVDSGGPSVLSCVRPVHAAIVVGCWP